MSFSSTHGRVRIESISERHHVIGCGDEIIAEVYTDLRTAERLASCSSLIAASKNVIDSAYRYDGKLFNGVVSISALKRLEQTLNQEDESAETS